MSFCSGIRSIGSWASSASTQKTDVLDIRIVHMAKSVLKLYRPLLCPSDIKGKSVTDHQQDT